MASVPHKRWKAAQDAEWEHFVYSWKGKELPTKSQSLPENFLLDPGALRGRRILEVGCGPAATIHSLREASLRIGIDPLASKWGHFYPSNTSHCQGVGEYLPFRDETIDVVLCINVLDHVQSPIAVLSEIYRCLKKSGMLILWLQTFSIFRLVRARLSMVDSPHPHHFSDSEVFFMLQRLGYSVDYHQYRRANFNSAISVIKGGQIISGLKSLLANCFLGLRESSYLCKKTKVGQNI